MSHPMKSQCSEHRDMGKSRYKANGGSVEGAPSYADSKDFVSQYRGRAQHEIVRAMKGLPETTQPEKKD